MASREFWEVLKVLPRLEGGALPTRTAVTAEGEAGAGRAGGQKVGEGRSRAVQATLRTRFPSLRYQGFDLFGLKAGMSLPGRGLGGKRALETMTSGLNVTMAVMGRSGLGAGWGDLIRGDRTSPPLAPSFSRAAPCPMGIRLSVQWGGHDCGPTFPSSARMWVALRSKSVDRPRAFGAESP